MSMKSDPFDINSEFQQDSEVLTTSISESCFQLLEAGDTFKILDDRGQEVQIQFEETSENEEELSDAEILPTAKRIVEKEEYNSDNDDKEYIEDPDDEGLVKIDSSAPETTIVLIESAAVNLVYMCPNENCRLSFPSKSRLHEHSRDCSVDSTGSLEICDRTLVVSKEEEEEEEEANLDLSEETPLECMNCDYLSPCADDMNQHIEKEHPMSCSLGYSRLTSKHMYACSRCNLIFQKKFHLVRHLKVTHETGPGLASKQHRYRGPSALLFKKHIGRCTVQKIPPRQRKDPLAVTEDVYSEANVKKGVTYKCVCTWCDYKSNKYSHVKKHIELYHEQRSHYPCKECVFVGRTVDDYAEHFNSFHKMDEYKHACTDCSFRCTNRTDMRNHYIEVHKKQRLYACKLCLYKAQDVMTIKKHISKTHSTFLFHCKDCNFSSNKKNEFNRHFTQVHGETCFKLEGDVLGQQIRQEVQEIVEKVSQSKEKVPDALVLEEQIFEEQILEEEHTEEEILEEQIEEEIISDFYEGSVMLLS